MDTPPPRGTAESPTGSSPADAALEIARFGSAVLRDVWAPEHLHTLREAIVGFCDRRAELVAAGTVDPLTRQYHEAGSVVLTWLILDGRIDLAFFSDMFKGSFYHEICREHFGGEQFYMAPERLGARNLEPPHSARSSLPYHQDSVEQDRRIERVLNCWIPLDPGAGRTSPGVEVVRDPGRPKFELKGVDGPASNSVYAAVAIDRDRILAEYGENFLAPSFEVGDSFVFSQDVIHRTHVTPEMTQPRIGFEFRVFSLNHLASWASADEVESRSYPLV
jgi:hypothetical protein